jgi:hypothetical protein
VRDRSPGFAATTAEFGADPGHLHHDTVVASVIIQGASRNLDRITCHRIDLSFPHGAEAPQAGQHDARF